MEKLIKAKYQTTSFIRNHSILIALEMKFNEIKSQNVAIVIWTQINNAIFDAIALDFIKLFEKNNEVYWKEIMDKGELENFEQELLSFINTGKNEFDDYIKTIRIYRNKVAAHSGEYKDLLPRYEIARKAVEFYHTFITRKLRPNENPSLEELYKKISDDTAKFINITFESSLKIFK